uniref:Uncharacterized protein n=1 Tax=Strongyloides stercoralis TaxID=6248 RepID=A0AAF5I482_STRER
MDSEKELCNSDLQKIHNVELKRFNQYLEKFCVYKKKSFCLTGSKNTISSKIKSYIKKKKEKIKDWLLDQLIEFLKSMGFLSERVLSNSNFKRFVYEMSVGYGLLESSKILGYYKLIAFGGTVTLIGGFIFENLYGISEINSIEV